MNLVSAVGATMIGSFFAAADAALGELPPPRLHALGAESGGQARAFRRYVDDPPRVLSRWLVGRIVCISVAATLVHDVAQKVGMGCLGPLAGVLAAILTYGTLTEILVTLARRRPEQTAGWALRLLLPVEWALVPLAAPLAALGRVVAKRLPPERSLDARTTETEVEWAVSEGERAGALENEPAEMIRNVLDFKDLTAREVMVPRSRVRGIELSSDLDFVLAYVVSEGHSRYPVFREHLDNVVGLLYAKDLFRVVHENRLHSTPLASLMRTPVMFVAETQSAAKILPEMQARRLHMAMVVDEFGGTAGVITLEDVIEEIVGDIRDEYDTEAQVVRLAEGHLLADAAISIADLNEYLKQPLPEGEAFESLGGLIIERAGRVPPVGATIELSGVRLVVREGDPKRVIRVEILEDSSLSGEGSIGP